MVAEVKIESRGNVRKKKGTWLSQYGAVGFKKKIQLLIASWEMDRNMGKVVF